MRVFREWGRLVCLLRVHLRVRARCLRAPVHTAMTRYDEVLIQNATDHVCRLDSRGAKNLMRVLRRVAASGRTIICSIHQPSSEVFAMFDKVVLLDGGELVYNDDLGPRYPFVAMCQCTCLLRARVASRARARLCVCVTVRVQVLS